MVQIKNITMTGSNITEQIPAKADSFTIQSIGGDVDISVVGDVAVWTLVESRAENFPNKGLAGSTFVFNGEAGVVVQIWYEIGDVKSVFGV